MTKRPLYRPWLDGIVEARLTKRDQAFLAFGKAMAAWAGIEAGLYGWFEHLTGLDLHQAKPIYYSATNFKSRLDLIRAAIAGVQAEKGEIDFIEEAMKLAQPCNSFRNKLAHGEFTIDGLVIQGKHASRAAAREEAISQVHLRHYALCFEEFASVLLYAREVAEGFIDEDHEPGLMLGDLTARVQNLRREMQEGAQQISNNA